MARTSAVAALRDRLAEVEAERDRLRAAIEAIPRHKKWSRWEACSSCHYSTWPCPTERAHIAAAATHQGTTNSSVGSGCDGDPGRVTTAPQGGAQSRPAPKDWPTAPRVLP